MSACVHLKNLTPQYAEDLRCQECIKTGDTWVHLRICQECGGVHCCDSSKNKHATKHFHKTGHNVVISGERGENWAWCYEDESFKEF